MLVRAICRRRYLQVLAETSLPQGEGTRRTPTLMKASVESKLVGTYNDRPVQYYNQSNAPRHSSFVTDCRFLTRNHISVSERRRLPRHIKFNNHLLKDNNHLHENELYI